jgi:CIC family chloride channel protein
MAWIDRHRRLRSRWRWLRRRLGNDDMFVILLAVLTGTVAGLGVIALRGLVVGLHTLLYAVPLHEHALLQAGISWQRIVAALGAGGLVYGLVTLLIQRRQRREPFDAIEANALHGGVMSMRDSTVIAGMTVGSVGLGASVGLEAGVTQLGAAAASWLGQRLRLNRSSLRTLVGCGAAAAIGAAFNAPLAGVFYALELVVGGYAVAALVPVAVASISGTLMSRLIFGTEPIFYILSIPSLRARDYLLFGLLGVAAAGIGVIVMRLATLIEVGLKPVAVWLRPAIGGLALAAIAIVFPQTLGSGHGAIDATIQAYFSMPLLLGLLAAKVMASAIAVGSGFRGGLFSASLLLGGLLGAVFWSIATDLLPWGIAVYSAYAVVGIGAVAASVVGAPLTMILLVFETTTDYPVAIGVGIGVLAATAITRRWFGYSFATWRFHVRGVDLRGAYDIRRFDELKVGHVLDRKILKVNAETKLTDVYNQLLASWQPVAFVQRENGELVGMVDAVDVNAAVQEGVEGTTPAEKLVRRQMQPLTPADTLSTALRIFESDDSQVAAVVARRDAPRLIGCVREADLLRLYLEEADRMRREELGAVGLFTSVTASAKPDGEQRR